MLMPVIGFVLLLWGTAFVLEKLIPWFNRNIFSKVWNEGEERKVVAREAIDRIKELCIDGDVPAEAAVMIAAEENKTTKEEIYASFNADDAKELVRIIRGQPAGVIDMLLKNMGNAPRRGMKGR